MADGRERAEWGRAYAVVARTAWQRVRPEGFVPDRYLPEAVRRPAADPNRARVENDIGWAVLGQFLRENSRN